MPEHISVLLDECIENLNIRPDGIYVDGTLGLGGHSEQILKRLTSGRLIGIDRDESAIRRTGERLKDYADKMTLVHGNFRASPLSSIPVCPVTDLQSAGNNGHATLLEILADKFCGLSPRYAVDKIRLLFRAARLIVTLNGERKGCDRGILRSIPQLRIMGHSAH